MINLAFFLGVSLPLAALYSSSLIILLSTLLLFVYRRDLLRNENNRVGYQLFYSAIPFLGIILFWSVAKAVNEIEFKSFLAIYKYGINSNAGLNDIFFLVKENILFSAGIFWILIRWLILYFLIILFTSNKKVGENFKLGMYVGTLVSCAIILLQILHIIPIDIFNNYSSFWHWQKRYYGAFSDPNSFGIFAFLILSVIFSDIKNLTQENQKTNRILLIVLFAIIFILGWFSGSRSYLLGLSLITFFYLIKNIKGFLPNLLNIKVLFVAIIFFSLCLLLVYNTSSGIRVIESLSIQDIEKSLFSRVIFWKICIWNWLSNPILGIGLDNFRNSVTPNLINRGIDLNLWSDNANSFYLGILSELGLVGVLCFIPLLSFFYKFLNCINSSLKYDSREFYCYYATVIVFAILLLLGPHLDFNEILIIFAFILGSLLSYDKDFKESFKYTPRIILKLNEKRKPFVLTLSLLIFLVIFNKTSKSESGLYAWERDKEGIYRWTRNKALVFIDCENYNSVRSRDFSQKTLYLKLQSLRIQNIVLKTPYESEKIVHFKGIIPQEIPIICIGGKMPVRIKTEKVSIPALDSQSLKRQINKRDNRILGIKVYLNIADNIIDDRGNAKF